MVIILAGIVSALAYSRRSNDLLTLSTQADRLASVIRMAQTLAMTQGQRYQVRVTGTTYDLYSVTGGVGTQAREPGTNQLGPFSLSAAVTIDIPPTNLANSLVTFDGRGVPYTDSVSPGSMLSPSAAVITLRKGTFSRTILITPETGNALVQ